MNQSIVYKIRVNESFLNTKKNVHQDGGVSYSIWLDSLGYEWNSLDEVIEFLEIQIEEIKKAFGKKLVKFQVYRYKEEKLQRTIEIGYYI